MQRYIYLKNKCKQATTNLETATSLYKLQFGKTNRENYNPNEVSRFSTKRDSKESTEQLHQLKLNPAKYNQILTPESNFRALEDLRTHSR